MKAGCYALDMYCDHPKHVGWKDGHDPDQYTGKTEGECMRAARRDGWKIGRGWGREAIDLCPLHSGKRGGK